MDPSLIGSQMSSDVSCEESSVAKERATTRPLVLAMNQRTFRFRQGEGRRLDLLTVMRVVLVRMK